MGVFRNVLSIVLLLPCSYNRMGKFALGGAFACNLRRRASLLGSARNWDAATRDDDGDTCRGGVFGGLGRKGKGNKEICP